MSKIFWTMKNGEKIDIDLMSVSHMRNTLKMLVRNNTKQAKKKEVVLNGDMANQFNENDDDLNYGYPIHDAECRGNQWT